MTFPELQVVRHDQGNPIRTQILKIKTIAKQTINQTIADPQAALLTGILLGDDNGLPPQLEEDFQTTGMSHIIAISGIMRAM